MAPCLAAPVPVLEVDALVKHFPVRGGLFSREIGTVQAVDGVSFDLAAGRDAGPRRRERLREVDDRQGDPASRRSHERHDQARRRGHHAARPRRHAPAPSPAAGDLPGSVCVARSADERGRDRRRAAFQLRHRGWRATLRAGRAAVRPRRPAAGSDAEVPARIFRRPAPASRDRAGARGRAQGDRLRRARLGARCLGAGAGHQPAHGPAGRSSACRISSSRTISRSSSTSAIALP